VTRYFAIASALVLSVLVIATAWFNRDTILRLSSLDAKDAPKPAVGGSAGPRVDVSIRGDAPWALSALPDCLLQTSYARGPLALVRSKLPRGARALKAGVTLTFGPCTISVGNGELTVQRGTDRLRVPPRITLYAVPAGLALVRERGKTSELRLYKTSTKR